MAVGTEKKRPTFIPYTPAVNSVIRKHGSREAKSLGNDYLGTEPILLGILAMKAGLAYKAFEKHAVELLAARKAYKIGLLRSQWPMQIRPRKMLIASQPLGL